MVPSASRTNFVAGPSCTASGEPTSGVLSVADGVIRTSGQLRFVPDSLPERTFRSVGLKAG